MAHSLRAFSKEDAKGVKDLILSVLTKEYPFDQKAYSDSDLDRIAEVYGGKRESFFVIEDDGSIVGTVGIKEETGSDALLRRLFVDSKHRKMGYGSELLKAAISFCKDNKYSRINFRCTDRMADAIRLCKKNGFKETDSIEVSGFNIHKLVLEI